MSLLPYVGGGMGGMDPFTNFERALDRAFERALAPARGGAGGDMLFLPSLTGPSGAAGHPMDIIEAPTEYRIRADAPGFSPEDVSVELADGTLTISGQHKEEVKEEKDGKVVRRERHFSQFTRSFTLPDNAREDGIAASLDKGVLTVTVPKAEPAPKPQPKRIAVQGAGGSANGHATK